MIEKILRTLLLESHEIRAQVGEGIYGGSIPGAAPSHPVIVIEETGEDAFYSLQNQIETTQSMVQIDCYHETPSKSRELARLVNRKISGMIRRTVAWMDDGEFRQDMIYTVIKTNATQLEEPPRDASDRWIHRNMLLYQVFYNIDAPTHT